VPKLFHRGHKQEPGRRVRPQPGRPGGVFSYYAGEGRGSGEVEARAKRTRRRVQLKYLPGAVAVVVIIATLFYSFVLDTSAIVVTEPAERNPYHTHQQYADAARTILRKSPANRSKLTINVADFKRQFSAQFPEAQDIAVSLPVIGQHLTITVFTPQPVAIVDSNGSSMVLDGNGRAILPLSEAPSSMVEGLPVIQDQSNLKVSLGTSVLPADSIRFILDVAAQLKAKKLTISGLILPALPEELHVQLQGLPYYVKFNLLGDARTQAGTFLAVKGKLEADKVTPSDYIDVRVEEKAFYK
jgi:hypothetical protein